MNLRIYHAKEDYHFPLTYFNFHLQVVFTLYDNHGRTMKAASQHLCGLGSWVNGPLGYSIESMNS